MFLERQAEKIEKRFNRSIAEFGDRKECFTKILSRLTGEEALCYRFLVGAMPLSDAASCDGELLLGFVENSLEMRRAMPWGSRIPAELFLNDVLFYRVNDENIENYRALFAGELLPRITGLSMERAALEVNYWCGEKGAYQSSDDRTVSPLTMLKNGRGRCGEESVFAVSALRSVGIPARQCYAPKWSHCDDNHAWVEAWVDGKWHYMGACEPEPVLDSGWFTYASSKAMMIHSRVFSDFTEGESVAVRNGCSTELNHLGRYADTAELFVLVLDEDKRPLPGARVQFQVVNYSALSSITELVTGEDGTAGLTTGLGTLIVHAYKDGKHMTRPVTVASGGTRVVLDFSQPRPSGPVDFDFYPPKGKIRSRPEVSREARAAHRKKLEQAEAVRREREGSFLDEAAAEDRASRYADFRNEIAGFLAMARGNREELETFLNSGYALKDKVALLKQLRRKDFLDCRAAQLEDTLSGALPYQALWENTIFQRYVLSPRIHNEYLVPYRAKIADFFSARQRAAFQREPAQIAAYIEGAIRTRDDLDYAPLSADPAGLLRLKTGSGFSKRILFVAVCRTFGIPARLHEVTGKAEYFHGGVWRNSDGTAAEEVGLTVVNAGYPLRYYQDFTIAKLVCGAFRTLSCSEFRIERRAELKLEPGRYRILLANRQIDAAVLARAYTATPDRSAPGAVTISGREGDIVSRLRNLPMRNAELTDRSGRKTDLASAAGRRPKNMIALIDVRREPTEHLLNELLELSEPYQREDLSLIFLVPDQKSFEYPLLRKILRGNPAADVYRYPDEGLRERLPADVQAGDRRLPLAIIADDRLNAKFHFSNYNVGTAALLLRIAENI